MKVKLQLDLASIKSWLLEHGEKVAFAIVAVVFLLFTYSAFSREVLEASKQPDELQKLADSVRQHVTSSTFDPAREGVQVVDYTERAMSKPVKPENYVLATPLNPPVTDPKDRRGDPEVLGAGELHVAAGFDVFSFKPDDGAAAAGGDGQNHAKLQPQPWAVVTGLVPLARQEQEFTKMFAQAVGADQKRDVPHYMKPVLERLEVGKEKWENVPAAEKYEVLWTGTAKELVPSEYTDPELTGNLGLLFYNEWGGSVSHRGLTRKRDRSAELPAATAPADAQAKSERSEPPAEEAKGVEYLLLRVFDYSVDAGKQYRYRVTLKLHNPNFGVSPLHLKNGESALKEELQSQPSEPTDVVTIPDGHGILAGPVDAGTRSSEPAATVVVTAIDPQSGIQAATELEKVRRGTMANKMQANVRVEDPRSRQVKEMPLDFKSNILLLDIFGGRTLPGRRRSPTITTPGEILLLDAQGKMMVRREVEDQALFEKSVVREKPAARPADELLEPGR